MNYGRENLPNNGILFEYDYSLIPSTFQPTSLSFFNIRQQWVTLLWTRIKWTILQNIFKSFKIVKFHSYPKKYDN